jgi:hypothetical protein
MQLTLEEAYSRQRGLIVATSMVLIVAQQASLGAQEQVLGNISGEAMRGHRQSCCLGIAAFPAISLI